MNMPSTSRAEAASPLKAESDGGALRLTLANPPANALSEALIDALQSALDAAAADESTRVVVIAAEGKIFSGGHDLKQMTARRGDTDGGRIYFEELFGRCARMMQTIGALPKPVIAEVGGLATAAGCQLVASCDIAIASENARFGVNGIDVGLFCSTPMIPLSRTVGAKAALDMLMTGEMIDAGRALAVGLVSRIAPADRLREETASVVERLLARPSKVLALGKKAFYEQLRHSLGDAYRLGCATIVDNMLMQEAQEGIAAFVEKRKPSWS
jgi:enoyl-CoA hydratase/carnithine racemase